MEITSLLTAFGLGSFITVLAQAFLKRRSELSEKQHEFKFSRYKVIILLAQALINWDDDGKAKMRIHRPDLKDVDDLTKELHTEFANALLFSSREVLKSATEFLKTPSRYTYVKLASAMRKDLWGRSNGIRTDILTGGYNPKQS